jgi:hypothetical protein
MLAIVTMAQVYLSVTAKVLIFFSKILKYKDFILFVRTRRKFTKKFCRCRIRAELGEISASVRWLVGPNTFSCSGHYPIRHLTCKSARRENHALFEDLLKSPEHSTRNCYDGNRTEAQLNY